MNKTDRNLVQGQAERWREYAQERAALRAMAVFYGAFGVMCGVICLMILLYLLGSYAEQAPDAAPLEPQWLSTDGPFIMDCLVVLAVFFGWVTRATMNQAASVPHVPSIHEQIADLPTEEVLLRGSVPPAAPPDKLLRAARQGTAVSSKELLRAELMRRE